METLRSALSRLEAAGFTRDFRAVAQGLRDAESGAVLDPERLRVEEVVRFEGVSDPDEEAILFALRSESGLAGTYVAVYGPAMRPEDGEVVRRLMRREA